MLYCRQSQKSVAATLELQYVIFYFKFLLFFNTRCIPDFSLNFFTVRCAQDAWINRPNGQYFQLLQGRTQGFKKECVVTARISYFKYSESVRTLVKNLRDVYMKNAPVNFM